jgi:hypothetical protein
MADKRTNDLTGVSPVDSRDMRDVYLDENNPWPSLDAFTENASVFFKGRTHEIEELYRRVQRRMLTVLFGISGLGKTSLVQAGLFPVLRKDSFMPVRIRFNFSAGAGEDLVEQVRTELRKALQGGRYYAKRGPEPKEDLWGFLHQPELNIFDREEGDRPVNVVFVFDQFEEIFTQNRGDPSAEWAQRQLLEVLAQLIDNQLPPQLKRELEQDRSLMRRYDFDEQDYRVLFCLREDYLPHLESLSWQIPSITENRFRLLPMSEEQALEAVIEPGRKIVDPLVARQIVNFAAGESETFGGPCAPAIKLGREHTVSPALLSLICSELNEERKTGDAEKITEAQVKKSTGGILDRFYDRCFQGVAHADAVGKIIEDRLLGGDNQREKIALATLVTSLQNKTGCSPDVARNSFDQLRERRLLQFDTRDGRPAVELTHDILTRIVADRKIRRERRLKKRKVKWIVSGAATLAMIAFIAALLITSYWARKEAQISWSQRGALLEVRKMSTEERNALAEFRFDTVAASVLWAGKNPKRLDTLKQLLQECADLQPAGYGIDQSNLSLIRIPDSTESWPLEVQYSSERQLDLFYFTQTWQWDAKFLAEKWGIPVPLRVKFRADSALPKRLVRLKSNGGKMLELDMPTYEKDAFITSKDLRGPAEDFLKRFQTDWTERPELTHAGPWWIVPRWSLPVWKVAGHLGTDGSGFPAFRLALELQKQPEVVLTAEAVELLLRRVAEESPETVKEARKARRGRLPLDLAELVKLGRPLTSLPTTLDALARYAEDKPSNVAAAVDKDVTNADGSLPLRLHGPWRTPIDGRQADKAGAWDVRTTAQERATTTKDKTAAYQIPEAYLEAVRWLPHVEPAIRIYMGTETEAEWVLDDHFSSELQEKREEFHTEFIRQFGFDVPTLEFRNSKWEADLPPRAFRIEMLNQTALNDDAKAITTMPGSALDRLIDSLRFRAEALRFYWLSAESVYQQQQQMTNTALRSWTEQKYSLTDLKLLQRAVVDSIREEHDALNAAKDDGKINVPSDHTIRHWEWLLGSLAFWAQVDDPLDLDKITQHLRATQRARLRPADPRDESEAIARPVTQGIQALQAGRITAAETSFREAIQIDRGAAIRSFLKAYPQTLRSSLISRFKTLCQRPYKASISRMERVDLEDLIADLEATATPETLRPLKLGLLMSYPESLRQKRRGLALDMIKRFGKPKDWPAADASVLALSILKDFDPLKEKAELRENAEAFLKRAIKELGNDESYQAFMTIANLANRTGPHNWCWRLMSELTEIRGDALLTLELAYQLSNREPLEDLAKSRNLAMEAERKIETDSEISSDTRSWRLDFARYARAKALERLTVLHGRDHAAEADGLLGSLLKSKAVGKLARIDLVDLQLAQSQYSKATKLVEAALSQWPGDSTLILQGFWAQLLAGNTKGALKYSERAFQKAQEDRNKDSGMLFVAALGQLLTMTGAWEETGKRFLTTEHDYVPYIAMMLYARLKAGPQRDEARQIIETCWRRAKPDTWRERLREGDESVWREMLIGYYLKKKEAAPDIIFGPLENDASFARSDLHYLPLARHSMLCEAYFYDALLADAENDKARKNQSLRRVLATNQRGYHEYRMALFLLGQTNP